MGALVAPRGAPRHRASVAFLQRPARDKRRTGFWGIGRVRVCAGFDHGTRTMACSSWKQHLCSSDHIHRGWTTGYCCVLRSGGVHVRVGRTIVSVIAEDYSLARRPRLPGRFWDQWTEKSATAQSALQHGLGSASVPRLLISRQGRVFAGVDDTAVAMATISRSRLESEWVAIAPQETPSL